MNQAFLLGFFLCVHGVEEKRTRRIVFEQQRGADEGLPADVGLSGDPESSIQLEGIPYALPPIGELRWEAPVEREGQWDGSGLDATRHEAFCPQYDHDAQKVVGNEDCLFLNVYTPVLPNQARALLPVMVFIHGGAYIRGAASSHGPQRLMREDIVVVTINYRIGVFGFLSMGDSVLPGNYGALDQIAALKWVRNHIAEFGGDPGRVTLAGFSAGAAFVHFHLFSPLSRDLFTKAIIMSGSGNCLWSVHPEPWYTAYNLAWDVDCTTVTSYRMKECLLSKSTNQLIEAQSKRQFYVYWPFQYRVVVDGGLRENPFLPAPMWELMMRPPTSPVPVLIGATSDEAVILFSGNPGNPRAVYEEAALYTFQSCWPNRTSARDVANVLTSYYYSSFANISINALFEEMSDAYNDLLFTSCLWDAASNLASTSKSPVYTYLMTHHDPNSPAFATPLYRMATQVGINSRLMSTGVSHGDDIIYIFSFPYALGQFSERDQQMSHLLTSFWANFIKNGSPQGPGITSEMPIWLPLQAGEPVGYFRLSLQPAMIFRPFRNKERNFWKQSLQMVEELSYLWYSWMIGGLFLLVLCLLLIVVVVCLSCCLHKIRRQKDYPENTNFFVRLMTARKTATPPPPSRLNDSTSSVRI